MHPSPNSEVYRFPEYYALGYRWNTEAECDFLEACLRAHGPKGGRRVLDIGCGSGRHLLTLAKRGYEGTGVDRSPEMIEFVRQQARRESLAATVAVDDLVRLCIRGTYDLAFCLMDTFRFLLTTDNILAHLRTVAGLLAPGGLYVTDFWVPRQWNTMGDEIYQWEQTEGETTVRVFYLQHPESVDPIAQTFEDELVFEVERNGERQTIRGGRTLTRLIMPQEFQALVAGSGAFELLSMHGTFELEKPLDAGSLSWRMISVLRKQVGG